MSYDDGFYNIQPCDIENMEETDKEIENQEVLIEDLRLELLDAEELVLNLGTIITKKIENLRKLKEKRGF